MPVFTTEQDLHAQTSRTYRLRYSSPTGTWYLLALPKRVQDGEQVSTLSGVLEKIEASPFTVVRHGQFVDRSDRWQVELAALF